jgi:hypothetical protein
MYIGGRSRHGVDGGHDLGLVLDRFQQRAEARVRVTPSASSLSPNFSNTGASQAFTAWPKMIGSETFIIVAFMCSENSTPSALVFSISSARKPQAPRAHEGGVDHGAGGVAEPVLQDDLLARIGGQHDFRRRGLLQRGRGLVGAEIAARHGGHARLAVGAPVAHAVRVGLGIGLDALAARRSELPSRRTGFTAEPLIASKRARMSFSASVCGSSG